MDYAEARAAFFQPRAENAPPAVPEWDTPARRLRDAIEPIATICFWSEPAYDEYAGLGLDFLLGYVWSRASVLGDAEPPVAASSFGVFEPGLICSLHAEARRTCSLGEVRAAKERGALAALHAVLGDEPGVEDAVAALRRGVAAADPTGRPLHAGLTALPWPDDPWGQLWHACTILREHRGDTHLAACVTEGLSGLDANLVTELRVGWEPLAYTASRGWSEDAMTAATARLTTRGIVADGGLTAEGRGLRDRVETTTDRLMGPVLTAIGDGLSDLVARLDEWSGRVVDRGWFPPDPYKRAAG